MARLREEEVRRLLAHLRRHIQAADQLGEIEDELRGEYGEEFLREPDLLAYFPEQAVESVAAGATWVLRIIPYTRMRMVQRGIKQAAITTLFQRFIAFCATSGELITTGPYTIFGRPSPRNSPLTLRADVDLVTDTGGRAHTVTVFVGRGESEGTSEVGPV